MLDRDVFVQGIYEELIEVIKFLIYIVDTIDFIKRSSDSCSALKRSGS